MAQSITLILPVDMQLRSRERRKIRWPKLGIQTLVASSALLPGDLPEPPRVELDAHADLNMVPMTVAEVRTRCSGVRTEKTGRWLVLRAQSTVRRSKAAQHVHGSLAGTIPTATLFMHATSRKPSGLSGPGQEPKPLMVIRRVGRCCYLVPYCWSS